MQKSPKFSLLVGTSSAHAWLPCLSTSEPLGMLDNVDGAWSAAVLSGAICPTETPVHPAEGRKVNKKVIIPVTLEFFF